MPLNIFVRNLQNFHNKLERTSLACLSSLVYCLRVRAEPTRVKKISGATLYGRLLAFHQRHKTKLEKVIKDKHSSLL